MSTARVSMNAVRASMGRSVVLYLFVAALIAAAGLWALRDPAQPPGADASARPSERSQPAPAVAADPVVAEAHVRVTGVRGTVERAVPGGPGWAPVSDGVELGVDDSLRTADGASAQLHVGERSVIGVAERSEVTVREVTRSVHRFKLRRGRVAASYAKDGARVLRIEAEDGSVVETREGHIGVVDTGAALAVAAESGQATLSRSGRTVVVDSGRQAVAPRDTAPGAAEPIPIEVWLRLADAEQPRPGDRTALVRGGTQPGARVWVNGTPAEVEPSGRFAARIPVHEGKNRVVALVEDALGRTARRALPPIVIERNGQVDDLSIRWGKSTEPAL